MLKDKSVDFRTLVFLRVTKKLIESTESYGLYKLQYLLGPQDLKVSSSINKTLKEIQKERKDQIKKDVKKKLADKPKKPLTRNFGSEVMIAETNRAISPPKNRMNLVPPRAPSRNLSSDVLGDLPSHLRYVQPKRKMQAEEINLDKLNPFISDPNVKTIEIGGENENVYVTGTMGKKPTNVKLSREEIEEIIDKFSKKSKIPKTEGLFKVTVGNLLFTAMVSESISSRFIIKKI